MREGWGKGDGRIIPGELARYLTSEEEGAKRRKREACGFTCRHAVDKDTLSVGVCVCTCIYVLWSSDVLRTV